MEGELGDENNQKNLREKIIIMSKTVVKIL